MFETIKAQTILGQIETIMVDNNSTDDSVAVARRLLADFRAPAIVRIQPNLGFCEGNNSGARAANGRYLFLPEHDTWMETDAWAVDCEAPKNSGRRLHAVCVELSG